MHRFRWFSILGVSCTLGIAACGDDGGGVPNPPDASGAPDAPQAPDAAPVPDGAPPVPDAGPRPDGPPPVVGGIVISEVVLFPQQDWGHSTGLGEAFDGTAGTGPVSSTDQYIEIQNTGSAPVNLSGWSIAVIDSSDGEEVITPLATDEDEDVVLSLGGTSTGTTLNPGDFAVLGNPIGTISNDALILLRDNTSTTVDDVEIGVEDFEEDGESDGAPAPNENGFSHGMFDESIARPDGAEDTNDDQDDFVKMYATPLAPNIDPAPSSETVAPRVDEPAGANNWRINQPVRAAFNEQVRAADVTLDKLTLVVNGTPRAIKRVLFTNTDSHVLAETDGVLPFGATVTLTVDGSITDYAGNPLGADATLTFTTEAAPPSNASVIINEVCVEAQQDWDHSSDNGTPFSVTPGSDATDTSSADEWIELQVSATGQSVNMTNFVVEVFNGPSIDDASLQVTTLNATKATRGEIQFSSGTLANVPAGARVVVGNPTGSMNNDLYLVVRDATGLILDEVEIGGLTAATDRGGDGVEGAGAGAPDEKVNGNSSGLGDETIIRRRDANGPIDTGNDVDDWVQGMATILGQNPL
jgi:hypothetical protein